MTDSIELRGLRVMAYCGILPEEELRRQPFEIDADIDLDLSAASMSDDLASTIDYGSLVERIDQLAVENRYGLLERFAGEIADVLLVPECGLRFASSDRRWLKISPAPVSPSGARSVESSAEAEGPSWWLTSCSPSNGFPMWSPRRRSGRPSRSEAPSNLRS